MNQITVKISADDYFKSQLMHYKFSISRLIGLGLVLAWIGYFLYDQAGVSAASAIGGTVGFMLWYTSYFLIYLRWRSKKIYNQQKSLHSPVEVKWNSESIAFINESGHANMKWSDFTKHKESDDLLMLYHSDVIFNFIPKSSFHSEEDIANFKSNLCHIGR